MIFSNGMDLITATTRGYGVTATRDLSATTPFRDEYMDLGAKRRISAFFDELRGMIRIETPYSNQYNPFFDSNKGVYSNHAPL